MTIGSVSNDSKCFFLSGFTITKAIISLIAASANYFYDNIVFANSSFGFFMVL
jgi:hypothetical protein